MKKILFLALLTSISFSCQNNRKEVKGTKTGKIAKSEKVVKTVVVDDLEKVEKIFEKFKSLYNELQNFKGNADFIEFGFGAGGPYSKWLKNIEKFKNTPDSKLLLKKGVVAGELEQLGFEYVSSKGKETEVTIFFNKTFKEAISPIKTHKTKTASGNSNYDNLKKNFKLFGRWEITNTTMNNSYPYEIYISGSKYIGVIPEDEFKTENLEKKGNNYFVKGNRYGEYYKIDSKNNMLLFDKDGELATMGYIAIKK